MSDPFAQGASPTLNVAQQWAVQEVGKFANKNTAQLFSDINEGLVQSVRVNPFVFTADVVYKDGHTEILSQFLGTDDV